MKLPCPVIPVINILSNSSNSSSEEDKISYRLNSNVNQRLSFDLLRSVPIRNPVFGLAIHRSDGIHITGPNTKTSRFAIDSVTGSGVVEYGVDSLPLTPGSYELSVAVYDSHIRRPIDHHEKLYSFLVGKGGTSERGGVVMLGGRWEHHEDR